MCPLSLSQTGVCETYRTERGAQRDRIPIRSGYGDSMIIGGAHVFAIRYRRGFQLHIFASWPYLGAWGVQIFANGPPTETRLEGEEEGDEEQEEEEEEEPNYFDTALL